MPGLELVLRLSEVEFWVTVALTRGRSETAQNRE